MKYMEGSVFEGASPFSKWGRFSFSIDTHTHTHVNKAAFYLVGYLVFKPYSCFLGHAGRVGKVFTG